MFVVIAVASKLGHFQHWTVEDVYIARQSTGIQPHLRVMPRLTTHSTRAELARLLSTTWMLFPDLSRRVNSGVRFLLNGLVQNTETANLNFNQAANWLSAKETWMLWATLFKSNVAAVANWRAKWRLFVESPARLLWCAWESWIVWALR